MSPSTYWFTGLSGAGKSTLARGMRGLFTEFDMPCVLLDGDEIRRGLCRDLGFSHEDRSENIRRIAEVAKLFNQAGLQAVAALISPYRKDRDLACQVIGPEQFVEVYVDTPLAICADRDVKGLYALAKAGEIPEFTGISAPYEIPARPALTIRTEGHSVAECLSDLRTVIIARAKRARERELHAR